MLVVIAYWLTLLKRAFLETSRFVALHKVGVALAPATLAPVYLRLVFGVEAMTNWWKIALSAAMGYATAFVGALFLKLITLPVAMNQDKTEQLKLAAENTKRLETEKETLQRELKKFSDLTARYGELKSENLQLKARLEQLAQPLISFSIASPGWSHPIALFYEEQGQERSRIVRPANIIATVKKHTPLVVDIVGVFLRSPHDSVEADIEFPWHLALAEEQVSFDITKHVLQALSAPGKLRLEVIRELSTTLRTSIGYASADLKGKTKPQNYRLTTKYAPDTLYVTIARL
jgi:hypothetical protein